MSERRRDKLAGRAIRRDDQNETSIREA